MMLGHLGIAAKSQSKGTAGLGRPFFQSDKNVGVDMVQWPSSRPVKVVKILSSSLDLNQPTLNRCQRVGDLPMVFLQCRRYVVGFPSSGWRES
jgi:hypothetical protein